MKRQILIFLTFFAGSALFGQVNLVPNGDFESYAKCPYYPGDFNDYVANWYNPTSASPDYFNVCSPREAGVPNNFTGSQVAHSGEGYIGIFNGEGNREHVSVRLKEPLQKDQLYRLSLYVSLSGFYKYCVPEGLDILLSDTAVGNRGAAAIAVTPNVQFVKKLKDTMAWMDLATCYRAKGGEQFLTIGDFRNVAKPNLTCSAMPSGTRAAGYLYIDDVVLAKTDLERVTKTFPLCNTGGTWTLNAEEIAREVLENQQFTLIWDDGSTGRTRVIRDTGTYVARIEVNCRNVELTINATRQDCRARFYAPSVFSPNGDGNNDVFKVESYNVNVTKFQVFNRWGALVYEESGVARGWDGQFAGRAAPEDVYIYVVTFEEIAKGLVRTEYGDFTLVR